MAALLDIVKKDSVDRSVTIRIIDSADGTPETGVVFNSAGIDLWYRREGAAKTSITEADLATPALTDAHADGGFLHISDGEYRLDLPDAAFATGANHVDVGGTVTGMVVLGGRVRLVNYDPEDAVRLGLTALPNAAADAAGGLPISDAGGLDLDAQFSKLDTIDDFLDTEVAAILAAVDTEIAAILADTDAMTTTGVTLADGVTHGGTTALLRLGSSSGPGLHVTSSATSSTAVYFENLANLSNGLFIQSGSGDAININSANAHGIEIMGLSGVFEAGLAAAIQAEVADALNAYDPPTNAEMVARTLAAAAYATAAAQTTIEGKIDTIDDFLDTELAAVLAAVDTEIAAILVDTGTDIPATLSGLLTTAMTEGYRATGATGSVRDLLYEMLGHLGEHANAGTTRTLKKLDGTTTSKTFTYDSASAPTSITETT